MRTHLGIQAGAAQLQSESTQRPGGEKTSLKESFFTEERSFEKPVAWLLGRQLIGGLKDILLYTAYGTKLDPRDWMQANVYPFKDRITALCFWRKRAEQPEKLPTTQELSECEKKARANPTEAEAHWKDEQKEFWFDYLADAGDGTKAMYAIAYLCMSDFYINNKLRESLPPDATEDECQASYLEGINKNISFDVPLPRGQFLFVGGDTAYHISDYMTLANRIQQPFKWAFEDLCSAGRLTEQEPRRPIFGIPGNHDYYDELDGFRRQFRRTIRDEPQGVAADNSPTNPQLVIEGFRREQEASYVAVRMPFDWWLWGLDTEVGRMDERQQKFFKNLCRDEPATSLPNGLPKKLIVGTCSPTTVFGKMSDKEDAKTTGAFISLGLSIAPFHTEKKDDKDDSYDLSQTGDVALEKGQCRLDISGDVHHYARYWGPRNGKGASRDAKPERVAPDAKSYASVVAGLGGAFHHPSGTYANELREQALYPTEDDSRQEVAKSFFNVKDIWTGGAVWFFGFILAFVIYFAWTAPQSSRQFLNNSKLLMSLGVTQTKPVPSSDTQTKPIEPIQPTVAYLTSQKDYKKPIEDTLTEKQPIERFYLWRFLDPWPPPEADDKGKPQYLYELELKRWPGDIYAGIVSIAASLILLVVICILFFRRLLKLEKDSWNIKAKDFMNEFRRVHLWLWLSCTVATVTAMLGILTVQPYHNYITPFTSSMLGLFTILWALGATALSVGFSELLFKKSAKGSIHRTDWVLTYVLPFFSVVMIVIGLWSFGRNNLPALLVWDITFVAVAGGLGLVIILAAIFKGGEMLGGWGKFGMFWVGVFHAILQIALPFLLVRKGSALLWGLALVAGIIFWRLGTAAMKAKSPAVYRWGVVGLWLVYGVVMLALPRINSWGLVAVLLPEWAYREPFMDASLNWTVGWNGLLPSVLAGLIGAVMCCLWLGWYLAVCFVFNGHNNEIGGAARIEDFKQFMRFRLTENDLTGYVIAVDKVDMIGEPIKDESGRELLAPDGKVKRKDGSYLSPRVIDVFRLTVQ